ncbi:hypothetical protein [Roseateles violae]|uniref:HTH OST-type domain-containing protein n=1 Tax=Roseateles violae TaxID=3058042 RepID=A0ABT8DK17_9BURK|nr:hypothetical protein [Pelomonas sp. PFR6]MDN3918732.1 hypothetical protein [Pelomonas sp. PFR6]
MRETEDKQHEVQRLLGRCMLRLQQYEALMKAVVAMHDIGGTLSTIAAAPARRSAELSTTNLGKVAERLFKSVIVPDGFSDSDDADATLASETEIRFRAVVRLQMPQADYDKAKQGVKDLVDLRNTLVHHFLELFDVWTAPGCLAAVDYLSDAYMRIDEHVGQLRTWADGLDHAKQCAAREFSAPEFLELLVNGIAPDGQVLWAASGIVACLREAARGLQADGWTPLESAIQFAAREHPLQTPERYGCRSWPHVLDASKLFDLRYTREPDAAKVAWYRERA